MNTEILTSTVPSEASKLLSGFSGKKITQLVRYSWWPAEEVGARCGISGEKAFSLTAGPLAVYFEDGAILGVASDSALNSVIVWDEAARRASDDFPSLDEDDELFPIFESGLFAEGGWRKFVGLSLYGFTILKRVAMNAKQRELPSEVGLRFKFEGDASFIASHGLSDGPDDFSVLEGYQLPRIELRETPISEPFDKGDGGS
jgi:hypothetical protein